MKKIALASFFAAHTGLAGGALAADPAELAVSLGGIEHGKPIPVKYAYCMPDDAGKTKNGGNINPRIEWSGAPERTKSFALLVVDPDVPQSFELANKEGKSIPEDFPRRNFYHWVLVDIPAGVTSIAEAADSNGVTKGGKAAGKTAYGINGRNDYPGGGYDGPCPPWNDERLHHYHFIVYALDVPSLNLSAGFGGKEAEAAMKGHILARGEVVGTYTNNPKLLK